jgi:HJR/Mrr/RecB family endonuclease
MILATNAPFVARRKHNENLLWPAPHLVGLFLAYAFVSPPLREAIFSIGRFFVALLILLVIVAIAIGTWRLIQQSGKTPELAENPPAPVHPTDAPAKSTAASARLAKRLRSLDPSQVEKLVVLIYRRLGYNVTRPGDLDSDSGIDLVINKDSQRTAIQWNQERKWNVSAKSVSRFFGALRNAGLSKGILIALRGYTGVAKHFAENHGIELLNGTELADLLEAAQMSSDPEALAILHDTPSPSPQCERELVLETA